jgi:hypothetical protein
LQQVFKYKTTPMTFNFIDQQRVGDKGEAQFLKAFTMFVKQHSKVYDFACKENHDITVELKTESYALAFSVNTRLKDYDPALRRTENIFMEYISCDKDNSPGGMWRAKINNVTHAVHLFLPESVYYWFNPQTIVPWLEAYVIANKLELISIKNRNNNSNDRVYSTKGYIIPINDIPPSLYTRTDL